MHIIVNVEKKDAEVEGWWWMARHDHDVAGNNAKLFASAAADHTHLCLALKSYLQSAPALDRRVRSLSPGHGRFLVHGQPQGVDQAAELQETILQNVTTVDEPSIAYESTHTNIIINKGVVRAPTFRTLVSIIEQPADSQHSNQMVIHGHSLELDRHIQIMCECVTTRSTIVRFHTNRRKHRCT